MQKKRIIIAIDGFSSCGKSTMAKELAAKLHYNFIDSGAMYRAITLYFIRNGVDIANAAEVSEALASINLTFEFNATRGVSEVCLNDENVEAYIRDLVVSDKVSEVAALKSVRDFAVAQQQAIGREKGIVMDGRDIGTSVFPNAELKIFVTADPDVRVMRRFREMHAKDPHVSVEEVKRNLELRDYLDTTREESPLRKADDACLLDNSDLTREEQLARVLKLAHQALETH
jgi:CMP/dCMP kinase